MAKTNVFPVVAKWGTCKILDIIESDIVSTYANVNFKLFFIYVYGFCCINAYEKGLRSIHKLLKKGLTVNLHSENETKGWGLCHKLLKRQLEDDYQIDNNDEDNSNNEGILASTLEINKTVTNTKTKKHNTYKIESHNLPSYPALLLPDVKKGYIFNWLISTYKSYSCIVNKSIDLLNSNIF